MIDLVEYFVLECVGYVFCVVLVDGVENFGVGDVEFGEVCVGD